MNTLYINNQYNINKRNTHDQIIQVDNIIGLWAHGPRAVAHDIMIVSDFIIYLCI